MWRIAKSAFEVIVVLIAWRTLTGMHAQTDHSLESIEGARLQNHKLQVQNDILQAQIGLQKEQDYVARRAELFATLYDRQEACDANERDGNRQCPLRAALRSRQEALKAFVRIEAERKAPDRSLADVDVPQVDLSGADLNHANLAYADLCGARDAKFTDALLCGADLRDTVALIAGQLDRAAGDTSTRTSHDVAVGHTAECRKDTVLPNPYATEVETLTTSRPH